ncbi:MAG: UDP-N-acetylmuramoyl-tripeptide--D-alanyl-D-alanine ligase [Clostridiales bacterium]|nr:UDP-N-acetylmuramoyl-tripeptide--D-alanyl-D-alanine ligase [Candidatus Equinaster intestinalis]
MFQSPLFVAICIIAAVTPVFALYRQFQMLQQNSYYPSRYGRWLYDSFFNDILALTIIFCAITILFKLGNTGVILELILISIYAASQIFLAVRAYIKSIKKLVFTGRVIRLYAAAVIICGVLLLLTFTNKGLTKGIFFSALAFLSVFSPALALLSWAVTFPIEKSVNLYFINDAKKIIASSPNLTVIGVTGSFGKTGTKFILARMLSERFNVVATPKSYNTPLGVVKTVRSEIRAQTEFFVCEMGAKKTGDIKEICDIVKPKLGIITAVGPQHLDTFHTISNVFATKFELYDACKNNGGEVFVNTESEELSARLGEKTVIPYGLSGENRAENITYGKDGSRFTIVLGDVKIPVATKLLGRHAVINIVGAAAVAYKLGVTPEEISLAVSRLEQTEHRLELKQSLAGSYMIDDAYNSNPEGCIEAVNVLSHFGGMKKVIITPGLVELGNQEYDFNYKLGVAATKVCDKIILVGEKRSKPMMDAVIAENYDQNNVHVVSSFKQALTVLASFADENTVFLVENDLPDNYLN